MQSTSITTKDDNQGFTVIRKSPSHTIQTPTQSKPFNPITKTLNTHENHQSLSNSSTSLITSIPSTSITSIPSTSITSIPSTSITSIPSIPSTSSTLLPTSIPSTSPQISPSSPIKVIHTSWIPFTNHISLSNIMLMTAIMLGLLLFAAHRTQWGILPIYCIWHTTPSFEKATHALNLFTAPSTKCDNHHVHDTSSLISLTTEIKDYACFFTKAKSHTSTLALWNHHNRTSKLTSSLGTVVIPREILELVAHIEHVYWSVKISTLDENLSRRRHQPDSSKTRSKPSFSPHTSTSTSKPSSLLLKKSSSSSHPLVDLVFDPEHKDQDYRLPSPSDPCQYDITCKSGMQESCCRTQLGLVPAEWVKVTRRKTLRFDSNSCKDPTLPCYPCASGLKMKHVGYIQTIWPHDTCSYVPTHAKELSHRIDTIEASILYIAYLCIPSPMHKNGNSHAYIDPVQSPSPSQSMQGQTHSLNFKLKNEIDDSHDEPRPALESLSLQELFLKQMSDESYAYQQHDDDDYDDLMTHQDHDPSVDQLPYQTNK